MLPVEITSLYERKANYNTLGTCYIWVLSTPRGLKRDYLGILVHLFRLRLQQDRHVKFSAAITDLCRAEKLSMTLFSSHALTLFVFWSGLPIASNGLPSTHKSHANNPFDLLPPFFSFAPPHLC